MQIGDVTEAHNRFRIGANGIEVDSIGYPIGAGASTSGKYRAHSWVAEGIVQVTQPIFVAASHVPPLVECMLANLNPQAPALQNPDGLSGPVLAGKTCR